MSFEHPASLAQFMVNRRNFLGMALASGTAFTLAACSQESTTSDSSESPESETRVVKNVDEEEITVPTKPQRVVVLSEPTLDAVLALGVKPVGAISGRGQQTVPNYLKDKVGDDVTLVGSVSDVNYDKVASLTPDLILADSTGVDKRSEQYKTLQDIAPVVYTGYAGGDWTINFERVADALNLVDQGKKVEEDYENLLSSSRRS